MNWPRVLLAKSTPTPELTEPWYTLAGHTEQAVEAALIIVEEAGDKVLETFGLACSEWAERVRRALALAALAHDLGKANDHFQRIVRGAGSGFRQGHRHELLSFWLVADGGPLREWILGGEDDVVEAAVLSAIVGHHLKFEKLDALRYSENSPEPRLTLLGDHVDMAATLNVGTRRLGLQAPPQLSREGFDPSGRLKDEAFPAVKRLSKWSKTCPRDERVFVVVVRSLLVAADVLSSTLAGKENTGMREWAKRALRAIPKPEDLRAVGMSRCPDGKPRRFQLDVARSGARVTLVRAGCGSGKTVAAYLWAAEKASGRKLFFTYPTTGTATEGFGGYVADADLEAGLFHSKASVDLELLSTGDEPISEAVQLNDFNDLTPLPPGGTGDEPISEADRWRDVADAVALWLPEVAVSTADLVLGLMQNYRTPLFAFPALGAGAFVFDEAHQYDDRMFYALCRFVEEARGTPILVMTATMPPRREEALRAAATAQGGTFRIVDGPVELEDGARYDVMQATEEEARAQVGEVLGRGGKVLWVCNTVDRCVDMGLAMAAKTSLRTYIYHSRFRYQDRARRHREVVKAFAEPGPAVAVTTQVCEISLDLSADLLVSDVAPVAAMIQRLGRLNRRFDPEWPTTRPALFVNPPDCHPYDQPALDMGRTWLKRVCGQGRSQRALAEAFVEVALECSDGKESPEQTEAVWMDRIPFAAPAPLREIEPSMAVLLQEDALACRGSGRGVNVTEVVRRAIPMPPRSEAKQWKRVGMAVVAPPGRIVYSMKTGARWAEGETES